jgi:membrane fusion protein (multidrug efflux system)
MSDETRADDSTEQDETRQEQRSSRSLGRRIGGVIGIVVLLVGAIILGRWVVWRIGHATTDAAWVKADIADVAPQVPGRIVDIVVEEGERVTEGQVLVRIDPEDSDLKLRQAEAKVAELKAKADRMRQELEQARRTVPAAINAAEAAVGAAQRQREKAEADLRRWRKQYKRFQSLLEERAVARARYEEVETAFRAARADAEAAAAGVALAEARLEEARAQRASIARAEAAVRETEGGIHQAEETARQARLARSWHDVAAPFAGVVARVLTQEGDFATPGRPILGLYDPATRYVEARFEETKLRYLEDGTEVTLTFPRLDDVELTGTVIRVAPAAAAEFALIPRDVTAGEFVDLTQRVPVRIAIADLESHPELYPGLSAEVAVAR